MKNMINEIPTYYDLKYAESSKIFEAEQIKGLSPDEIQKAESFYKLITEKLENGETIDEGILGSIAGGIVGGLAGPVIMKSICKILGINEMGPLGSLLCSRLVTTSVGVVLGNKVN